MMYYIWAEHTHGGSIGHPCRKGVWDDPADQLDMRVEADSEDAAHDAGMAELLTMVGECPPCDCERRLEAGSDSWWQSVVVIASRTPYPLYTGDDAEEDQ